MKHVRGNTCSEPEFYTPGTLYTPRWPGYVLVTLDYKHIIPLSVGQLCLVISVISNDTNIITLSNCQIGYLPRSNLEQFKAVLRVC